MESNAGPLVVAVNRVLESGRMLNTKETRKLRRELEDTALRRIREVYVRFSRLREKKSGQETFAALWVNGHVVHRLHESVGTCVRACACVWMWMVYLYHCVYLAGVSALLV